MRKLLIITIAIFIGCTASRTTIVEIAEIEEPIIVDHKLYTFFEQVKTDLDNYGNVAIKEDLVLFLSHFKKMDSGGRRYYLLERENITKMVESVTQKIYSDSLLLDIRGNIIYTRVNNTIFAGNIARKVNNNTLLPDLLRNDFKYYITDPLKIDGFRPRKVILACKKISSSETCPGFAMLQIDTDQINSLLKENEFVLDINGICLFANDIKSINKPYKYFSYLDIDNLASSRYHTVQINKNLKLTYENFTMANMNWILVEEKR
jgi:hypothetical protein